MDYKELLKTLLEKEKALEAELNAIRAAIKPLAALQGAGVEATLTPPSLYPIKGTWKDKILFVIGNDNSPDGLLVSDIVTLILRQEPKLNPEKLHIIVSQYTPKMDGEELTRTQEGKKFRYKLAKK